MFACTRGQHSPYSIPLVKRRDHGRWVFRHQGHQQLEHIVDILILRRKESQVEQVNKRRRGSPSGQKNRRLRGQRQSCRGGLGGGGGLRRSRWYFRARIDIIVTEEYILFSPLLRHFSCCHSTEADSHSHSFKWTITPAHKLSCTFSHQLHSTALTVSFCAALSHSVYSDTKKVAFTSCMVKR